MVEASERFYTSVPHETDDIADILQAELPGLGDFIEVHCLSASAKEFTPGEASLQANTKLEETDCGGGGEMDGEFSIIQQGQQGGIGMSWESKETDGTWTGQGQGAGYGDWGGQSIDPCMYMDMEGTIVHKTESLLDEGTDAGAAAMYDQCNEQCQQTMEEEVQLQLEMLELMSEAFSDCSPECLQVSLGKSDWDMDKASSAVLYALEKAYDPDQPWKACRHLLQGDCFRRDCSFSHDFASTTCRYWLQGTCRNGVQCLFLHDLDVDAKPKGEQVGDEEEEDLSHALNLLEIHQFPSLTPQTETSSVAGSVASSGASSTSSAPQPKGVESRSQNSSCSKGTDPWGQARSTTDGCHPAKKDHPKGLLSGSSFCSVTGAGGGGRLDADAAAEATAAKEGAELVTGGKGAASKERTQRGRGRAKRGSRAKNFSRIDALITNSREGQSGLNFSSAVPECSVKQPGAGGWEGQGGEGRSGCVKVPVSFADVAAAPVPAPPVGRDAKGGDQAKNGNVLGKGRSDVTACTTVEGKIEWVSTGEAVRSQYARARMEAAELARSRNAFFMAATKAFRRGDGKSAKALAERGREANCRMKDKHRIASKDIYRHRNPHQEVILRGAMDLHGLHIQEAVSILEEQLPVLPEHGLSCVSIITGSGHHSKGGGAKKARLLPAVERLLTDWGLTFQRVCDRRTGHIGMLNVNLQGLLNKGGVDGGRSYNDGKGHTGAYGGFVGGVEAWYSNGRGPDVQGGAVQEAVVIR